MLPCGAKPARRGLAEAIRTSPDRVCRRCGGARGCASLLLSLYLPTDPSYRSSLGAAPRALSPSFVLCFEASGWDRRRLFCPCSPQAPEAGDLTRSNPSIWSLIPLYPARLRACMVCHGELARSKPIRSI